MSKTEHGGNYKELKGEVDMPIQALLAKSFSFSWDIRNLDFDTKSYSC